MKRVPLKLGIVPAKVVKGAVALSPVDVLDDAAIDESSIKQLRDAYRALRTWRETHRCEEVIGERTKEALSLTREKGKKTGGYVRLGYQEGEGRLELPDKRERQIMKIAKTQHLKGDSLRTIAASLETEGFVARNGKRFVAAQVKRLIERAGTFDVESRE